MLKMPQKKNNMDTSILINLLYYFCQRCEKETGTKYHFYKILKDVIYQETNRKISVRTIYKFLDNLETYGALELINAKKGYRLNRKNLEKFYSSYDELQKCNWLYQFFKDILIEF